MRLSAQASPCAAEAEVERGLLSALPVVERERREFVLPCILLQRRHELQGARLAAVDVDERGERDVPRVGGDQRGEAERPPADEAREDRRPIVPRGLRSVLVVSMVPVKCYKAGERENEEHVAAGLEADGAVAHGVCSPFRRGAHVRSSRRRSDTSLPSVIIGTSLY